MQEEEQVTIKLGPISTEMSPDNHMYQNIIMDVKGAHGRCPLMPHLYPSGISHSLFFCP